MARTPRQKAPGEQPAFPVPHAKAADFLGFTKSEIAATLITAGIFAGPYGKVIMDSTEEHKLEDAADVALKMFDKVLERISARSAS